MDALLYLAPLFFATAVVYSSAGFGGGSTYLALLALFGFSYTILPQIALVCNLTVVVGGFLLYVRSGDFSWRRCLPFVVLSIPAAYVGGSLPVEERTFLTLLGLTLLFAGSRLFWTSFVRSSPTAMDGSPSELERSRGVPLSLGVGAGIGFLSGVVGIGGGIFLAPIAYFLRWGTPRHIAALTTFFILVNSASGLAGQWAKSGFADWTSAMLLLPVSVFLGGQIGTRLAIRRYSPRQLQRITALIILVVAVRVLSTLV